MSFDGFVSGVQFRGQEVDGSGSREGNTSPGRPVLSHASGRIDAPSACLPVDSKRSPHVAQEPAEEPATLVIPPEDFHTHRLASSVEASGYVPETVRLAPGAASLRVACGWCLKELRAGVEPTSHGICPPCADKWAKPARQILPTCDGPTGACVLDFGHGGDHRRGK